MTLRLTLALASVAFLTGCPFISQDAHDSRVAALDADGDGSPAYEDCDDINAQVHPGVLDTCDGVDSDCDGVVDSAPQQQRYADGDGDGFGAGEAVAHCDGAGWSDDATDCDDTKGAIHPGASEVCNGVDDNCDGETDNTPSEWYPDGDGDGYASDSATGVSACQAGYVAVRGDCRDDDAAFHPGAVERCDGADEDCDGQTDEGAVDAPAWFTDADGDGHGEGAWPTTACAQPAGASALSDDCDDSAAGVYPGAEEACDGVDNDCDGQTDETPPDWYKDGDGDGHGIATGTGVSQCSAPTGSYVLGHDDCDDGASAVYPGASEVCNGVDDDCDGEVDDADPSVTGTSIWYADSDGDSYGWASTKVQRCAAPAGFVANAEDCNDGDATLTPQTLWYADDDLDGSGASSDAGVAQCAAPAGRVRDHSDCDDADNTLSPTTRWYLDSDADGYGSPTSWEASCLAPVDHVRDSADCDDTDALLSPETQWMPDTDGDGFASAAGVPAVQCPQPTGYVLETTDCDDGDAGVFPGATPACEPIDRDCDGHTDDDWDGDGHVAPTCGGVDCDDTDASIKPEQGGGCTLYNDCTELQAIFPNAKSGAYAFYLKSAPALSRNQQLECDMTTDGGAWTLVRRTVAGTNANCLGWPNSVWDLAINVSQQWWNGSKAGGEVLSVLTLAGPGPESVVKLHMGAGMAFNTVVNQFNFQATETDTWMFAGTSDFGLQSVSGTTYPNIVYWDGLDIGGNQTELCLGGGAPTAEGGDGANQVCIWTNYSYCQKVAHGDAWLRGLAYGEPATHELYVRAP